MILIPAIDILGGKCVRLFRGDYDQATEYSHNPAVVAEAWRDGGAKRIHLVDLDGARTGRAVNEEIILSIGERINTPIEVGGGIRDLDQIDHYLSSPNIDRVILGTAALKDPTLLADATSDYPGHIWVGIDGRGGRVAVEGWTEDSATDVYDLAAICEDVGVSGIIFTDISRDGTLVGPNLSSLRRMAERVSIPVIASGGVSSLDDLRALRGLGLERIEGVIVGKALYTGAFTVEEGIEVVGG
ncbi:MAG: 1-(5-phosphoribosyl)-5-[(5-phosphoribosylamino)methylideneamino]imidazole-4-carboxamide isomerase [Candidatus Omnitrophica bacterium]|nr:1-(5-phosphoribosyl)-5-[(5-phosphoribosylamino)methylideneamino] imidazole-4-carboxamide isomerase [bacterium]NUN98169.1 1-(5-phosphoribosyl)-5-[(5-phosphoribosylamino)methylideneamino]imidazole-4-carboxamide isomerase [Candidatus Omnitrophota bacterium]